MTETQALYRQKLDRWRTYMQHYSLPDWDHLPDMELYIDQVVTLVCRYLELIPQDESNPLVTASSINNYVRLKVMPAPVKKRYSMALTEIPKILPSELDEEAVRVMYNAFTARVSAATQTFITQVDAVADQELAEGNAQGCTDLVLHSAVNSVLYKLLTVKLTNLPGLFPAEDDTH